MTAEQLQQAASLNRKLVDAEARLRSAKTAKRIYAGVDDGRYTYALTIPESAREIISTIVIYSLEKEVADLQKQFAEI